MILPLGSLILEYSCWMARSVLLPGYMYLTTNHVCFYANLPSSHVRRPFNQEGPRSSHYHSRLTSFSLQPSGRCAKGRLLLQEVEYHEDLESILVRFKERHTQLLQGSIGM
jgi:hypothetical protein